MSDNNMLNRLVIFEMANNHMGDVSHGINLIRAFAAVKDKYDYRFAFKFQYRNLDSFIHPDYQKRTDIKYIKRFLETRLSESDFLELKKAADDCGFLSMCTAFDESSLDMVIRHGYDIVKIASCSFTDWPLLEKIAMVDKPLIASTAGALLNDIDAVTAFFSHRGKEYALLHCVGMYPTPDDGLELNQIDFFKERYPGIPIGYSTHETPSHCDPVKLAMAKGACIFERHVGLPTAQYELNAYSSSPTEIERWLDAMSEAEKMCGIRNCRRTISVREAADLRGLQRGVFVRHPMRAGDVLNCDDLFFAIPNVAGQLVANDISKYRSFCLKHDLPGNAPVMFDQVEETNQRAEVLAIIRKLCELMKLAGLKLQDQLDLELSHHYGLARFYEIGCSIITCVNREYCKKIILLLPGQKNPTHTHRKKEETFHVLYGDLELTLGEESKMYPAGSLIVVERGVPHSFSSKNGAVLEEISTTHYQNDSFYDATDIQSAEKRKTYMTFRSDWLTKEII